MATQSSTASDGRVSVMIATASLLFLVLSYIALCLVVLCKPYWLPTGSIFSASLIGPPYWLVWGPGTHTMFWVSTLAVAVVAVIGACSRVLVLPCAGLCFLIWLSSGFLAVVMSV
jgi:hypothetical protein